MIFPVTVPPAAAAGQSYQQPHFSTLAPCWEIISCEESPPKMSSPCPSKGLYPADKDSVGVPSDLSQWVCRAEIDPCGGCTDRPEEPVFK
ncbi:hypothetical protein F7725_015747 [Dissostichus mawsoni]|uniref:Uncharacterized protein n=1 Tax=Dissostichus mawsoni TaxID=36200 RepID=A0A7J5YIS3_DISMA|nr:hypothetical protein F7725_015747 [Dissostichus mawsoni]